MTRGENEKGKGMGNGRKSDRKLKRENVRGKLKESERLEVTRGENEKEKGIGNGNSDGKLKRGGNRRKIKGKRELRSDERGK